MPDRYYTRICWNDKGWRWPTGTAALLERDTYAANHKFGHEEWLFNLSWLVGGYHYAFLQPIEKSINNWRGKSLDLALWAINPQQEHVHVGQITACEVLTANQSTKAYEEYKKRGWLKLIDQQIKAVSGYPPQWDAPSLFNVRFFPANATQYDPYVTAEPSETIARLTRYRLVADKQEAKKRATSTVVKPGSVELPIQQPYERKSVPSKQIDPQHPLLQARLMKFLQEEFGKNCVRRESANRDLVVMSNNRKILIEIKTYPMAKQAIREALGQILEYAYCNGMTKPTSSPEWELFIIAPGIEDEETSRYLNFLREKFRIPICYSHFSLEAPLPEGLRSQVVVRRER